MKRDDRSSLGLVHTKQLWRMQTSPIGVFNIAVGINAKAKVKTIIYWNTIRDFFKNNFD